ncbi:hypothetical protein EVAR_82016_1 [Eumeta japonica]|uniref:Uncharacterized protein n=1 Tax=Eumeta variegata TaxID=151549 RepID=A0A4C1VTS9_EUMVA|nr:hypothetical protein EVAR_82016_1 [Eumeta japonica]
MILRNLNPPRLCNGTRLSRRARAPPAALANWPDLNNCRRVDRSRFRIRLRAVRSFERTKSQRKTRSDGLARAAYGIPLISFARMHILVNSPPVSIELIMIYDSDILFLPKRVDHVPGIGLELRVSLDDIGLVAHLPIKMLQKRL